MSNELALANTEDGWGDAAAEANERVIKGTLLKFSDWNWSKGKEGTAVENGTTLVALDSAAGWVRWQDGKPKDPWQNTRFVYLVDPVTAEAFTFSTSSWGGRGAVSDLADQIQRMRFAQPGAVPVVELQAAPMLTKFGKKSKPWFKVVDWRFASPPAEPELPRLPSGAAKAIADEIVM